MVAAPVFLLGRFHGQRSLAGDSPRGHKESDMTEGLSTEQHGELEEVNTGKGQGRGGVELVKKKRRGK